MKVCRSPTPAPPSTLVAAEMQLVFGEDGTSSALDLQVERYHGCYFVRS